MPNIIQFTVQKQSLPGLFFKQLFCTEVLQSASLIFFIVVLNNKLFSLRWAKLHLPHPPCSLQHYGTSQGIQEYSLYQSWSLFKTMMGSQGFLCQHSCWIIIQLHYLWGSPLFQCSPARLYCLLGAHRQSWETPQEACTERPYRLQHYHLSLSSLSFSKKRTSVTKGCLCHWIITALVPSLRLFSTFKHIGHNRSTGNKNAEQHEPYHPDVYTDF